MAGEQKGKKHRPGAGRPRLVEGQSVERATITLPPELMAWARAEGKGNLSAGLRRLLEDLDQLLGERAAARQE